VAADASTRSAAWRRGWLHPRLRVTASGVALGLVALAGLTGPAAWGLAADREDRFLIGIENASVKVGEKATIVATITTQAGFKITESYRHRILQLAGSDGIELGGKVVRGSVRDGHVVFLVGVTPRKAGTHTVTGWFRFSVHNGQRIDITSAPFEATVTATE
jgi:hypothetical protein